MAETNDLEARMKALEQKAAVAEDIESIKRLKHKYFRCLDSKLWDEMAQCFTEDATTSYTDGKYSFRGVEANTLLSEVGDQVAASAGAACHAGTATVSYVLQAMGVVSGRLVKDATAYPPHTCNPPTKPEGYNSWGPQGSVVVHGVGSIWECDCGARFYPANGIQLSEGFAALRPPEPRRAESIGRPRSLPRTPALSGSAPESWAQACAVIPSTRVFHARCNTGRDRQGSSRHGGGHAPGRLADVDAQIGRTLDVGNDLDRRHQRAQRPRGRALRL